MEDGAESSHPMPSHLLALSDELLLIAARHLLAARDVRALLRFSCTCKATCCVLSSMRAEAENRRLHWDEQMGYGGTVSHHKQTVTNSYICHRYYYSGSATCWAAGCVLPSQGETTVTFRVDNMNGAIAFGVADAFARRAWGFDPRSHSTVSFRLIGSQHDAVLVDSSIDSLDQTAFPREPSSRLPSVHPCRSWVEDWGSLVTLSIDHAAGTLTYRIDQGVAFVVFDGFVPSAVLRPWVRLYAGDFQRAGSQVSLIGWI